MKNILLIFFISYILSVSFKLEEESTTFSIKFIGDNWNNNKFESCEIIEENDKQNNRLLSMNKINNVIVERFPQFMTHDEVVNEKTEIVEVFGLKKEMVVLKTKEICSKVHFVDTPKNKNDELTEILITGPVNNRIGVVYMGDGYVLSEKQRHIDDMKRLHDDMFDDVTFKSYLPVFNVWSVFRRSQESGVGTHGRAKNTAYRLYRQGTELRGLFPGNPSAIREACRAAPICTFPTVIGNDDYYGGLGGEFVISTRSKTTGTMVLRHEQGHNYGRIGEEYDSPGGVYSGANFASTIAEANSKWGKWLNGTAIAQNSENNINAYPWRDLDAGPVTINFRSNGNYKRWSLKFSVSGCPEQDSIEVLIDGQKLDWKTQGLLDRSFYYFHSKTGFSSGSHILTFRQLTRPNGPIRQVCNVGLNSYMNSPEFNYENNYINAYPIYVNQNRRGFRSQNEACLMRNMTSVKFCAVCEENLWLQFFRRMNCIDTVKVEESGENVKVTAVMVKIGQFRNNGPINGEKFSFIWSKNGQRQNELNDKHEFTKNKNEARGSWTVESKYTSLEIRNDPSNVSTFKRSFSIN